MKKIYSIWCWSDENFKDNCVYVHMGGSWGKKQELDSIKSGHIWYKKAEVYSAAVNIFGNIAILLNDIDLMAMVGGKDVLVRNRLQSDN